MPDSERAITDLAALVHAADLIVVARVAADGTSRLVVQPDQTPPAVPPPPPQGLGDDKSRLAAQQPPAVTPTRQSPAQVASSGTTGLPVTDFPVEVERVVRGAGAVSGARITVIQPGGSVKVPIFPGGPARARRVQIEDDSLMSPGERYVLFLRAAEAGAFRVVGGAQGRLTVDAQDRVHPLHPGIPPTRGHDGQTLSGFLTDVAAIT